MAEYYDNVPQTAAEARRLDGMQKPLSGMGAEQPLDDDEKALRDEAYRYLTVFIEGCQEYHNQVKELREVVRMRDPRQDDLPKKDGEGALLQLQTLKSTFNNCVADQMDNMPEAVLMPERPELQEAAEDMTDVVRFVLNQNGYEGTLHRRRVEDYLIGTALTQIVWDRDADDGHGDVALIRWPVEAFLWDPAADDIQDGRANIKVSWHPLSWFVAHYPDAAQYIGEEEGQYSGVGLSDALQALNGDEGRAMLMEYWYRRYDATKKKYTINVAYFAGGALLEHKKDVYKHGLYPFVMEPFDYIEGKPVGDGLVGQLRPEMQYINRYAHYIDENLRMAAKNRLLVRKNAQLDVDALADFDQNIIEGQNIDEESVRWFQSKPLPNMVTQQMVQFQTDMKQDSGQSQWQRGETAGGVTAAAAISALQEAGGKLTRNHTQMLNQGFKKIVEQILWLICQFYTDKKERMITGKDGKSRLVIMSAEHLRGEDAPPDPDRLPPPELLMQMDQMLPGENGAPGLGTMVTAHAFSKARAERKEFTSPPYSVQIQISRRNPLRVQAQNELFIQAYMMAAQAGQMFPLKMLFEILQVDGKDKIMPVLEEVDQQTQLIQQLSQENEMLKENVANLKGMVQDQTQQMLKAWQAPQQSGPGRPASPQTGGASGMIDLMEQQETQTI